MIDNIHIFDTQTGAMPPKTIDKTNANLDRRVLICGFHVESDEPTLLPDVPHHRELLRTVSGRDSRIPPAFPCILQYLAGDSPPRGWAAGTRSEKILRSNQAPQSASMLASFSPHVYTPIGELGLGGSPALKQIWPLFQSLKLRNRGHFFRARRGT